MNRRLLGFFTVLLLVGALASCRAGSTGPTSPTVVTVNGVAVTQADLDREMNHTKAYYREQNSLNLDDPQNADLLKMARTEALTRTIDQELVRQIAEGIFPPQSPAVTISDAEVQARAQEYEAQAATREQLLSLNGFATYDEFLAFVRGILRVEKLAELYGQAEQIHARHILVATKEEATQVLARIAGGEDFAAVAQEVSLDKASGVNGGDLGWFGRGQMVQPFEEAAFALEVNQLSQPVQTQFGYHIIQVLEKGMRADPQAFETWFQQVKAKADIKYGP